MIAESLPGEVLTTRWRLYCVVALLAACALASGVAATNSLQTNDPLCAVPGSFKQGPGTTRMIARLQEIPRATDPRDTMFMNSDLVPMLEHARSIVTNAQDLLEIRIRYAGQLLRAGRSLESMTEFDALPEFIRANHFNL